MQPIYIKSYSTTSDPTSTASPDTVVQMFESDETIDYLKAAASIFPVPKFMVTYLECSFVMLRRPL